MAAAVLVAAEVGVGLTEGPVSETADRIIVETRVVLFIVLPLGSLIGFLESVALVKPIVTVVSGRFCCLVLRARTTCVPVPSSPCLQILSSSP